MIGYGAVPFFEETRQLLLPTLISTFADNPTFPHFATPPPPRGDAVRAVIYEWEIDPDKKPGCHDLELGEDGTVYTVGGVFSLNPKTMERRARRRLPLRRRRSSRRRGERQRARRLKAPTSARTPR